MDETNLAESDVQAEDLSIEEINALIQSMQGEVQQDSPQEDETEARPVQRQVNEIPEIPVDDVDETTARFSGAIWFDQIMQTEITIAGAGGIGSWLAVLIAKMHPRVLKIYDSDTVQTVNMVGQLLPYDRIGTFKADTVCSVAHDFSGFWPMSNTVNIYTGMSTSPVVMCGVDSMYSRMTIFKAWKAGILEAKDPSKFLFIDGRLAAEHLQILCVTGDDTVNQDRYESEYLFSDDEADTEVCSYKQTAFAAAMIAGLMANMLVNFISIKKGDPRQLPFFTEYDARTMFLSMKQ